MDWSNPIRAVIPGLEGPVLTVLATAARPLTGSEVHRSAGAGSNAGVRIALERLVMVGTVTATRVGSAIVYLANREHLAWPAIQAALDAFDPRGDLQNRLVSLLRDSLLPTATVAIQGAARRPSGVATQQGLDLVLVVPDDALADDVDALARQIEDQVQRWTGNPASVHAATAAKMLRDMASGDPVTAGWGEATRALIRAEVQRHTGQEQ